MALDVAVKSFVPSKVKNPEVSYVGPLDSVALLPLRKSYQDVPVQGYDITYLESYKTVKLSVTIFGYGVLTT
jgi:hypothetical protein